MSLYTKGPQLLIPWPVISLFETNCFSLYSIYSILFYSLILLKRGKSSSEKSLLDLALGTWRTAFGKVFRDRQFDKDKFP